MNTPNPIQNELFKRMFPVTKDFNYWNDALENITDALVENIINTSDEEIIQEIIDDGRNPKEIANRIRNIINNARVHNSDLKELEK